MPVDRVPLSSSQLAELLGVDAKRLIDVELTRDGFVIVLEPEERNGRTDGQDHAATANG